MMLPLPGTGSIVDILFLTSYTGSKRSECPNPTLTDQAPPNKRPFNRRSRARRISGLHNRLQ